MTLSVVVAFLCGAAMATGVFLGMTWQLLRDIRGSKHLLAWMEEQERINIEIAKQLNGIKHDMERQEGRSPGGRLPRRPPSPN